MYACEEGYADIFKKIILFFLLTSLPLTLQSSLWFCSSAVHLASSCFALTFFLSSSLLLIAALWSPAEQRWPATLTQSSTHSWSLPGLRLKFFTPFNVCWPLCFYFFPTLWVCLCVCVCARQLTTPDFIPCWKSHSDLQFAFCEKFCAKAVTYSLAAFPFARANTRLIPN